MEYIKRIDGLRGLSVLAVLFYHLDFTLFHGGFIGVDIFFVISGFLITGIIQSSIDKQNFNLLRFYERRVKRLLPALYVMLFIMAILAVLFYLPHEVKDIYQAILATTVYLSNIFNYREIDYFNTFFATSPLLHTWSLSVEEQFYFFYPLILFFTRKMPVNQRLILLVILSLFSFSTSVYYMRIDKLYAFYYTWFRAWELGLGGITFLCLHQKIITGNVHKAAANILYHGSVLTILLSVVFCRVDTYIPNFAALPAVIATCILLAFNFSGKVYFNFLESKPMIGAGLLSYSLYLWHQPILSVMYKIFGELDAMKIVLTIIFSFAAAFLSWKYVETPVRHAKINSKWLWTSMLTFSSALIGLGLWGHYSNGFYKYFVSRMSAEQKGWFVQRDVVFSERRKMWDKILEVNEQQKDNLSDLDYLIIGDSKAEDMLVSFYSNQYIRDNYRFHLFKIDDNFAKQVAEDLSGGTIKNKSLRGDIKGYEDKFKILEQLDSLKVKNIIFTCTWQDKNNPGVARLIELLSKKVKHTYVVSTCNWNDVSSLSMELAKSNMNEKQIKSFLYKNLRADWKRQSDNLKTLVAQLPNVSWVDKEEAFCNNTEGECTLYTADKAVYVYDTGHFTITGVNYFGAYILNNHWFGLQTK